MKASRTKIERFTEGEAAYFRKSQIGYLKQLNLSKLLSIQCPLVFHSKRLGAASGLVHELLNASLFASEQTFLDRFIKELAIFIASETSNGKKSAATGVDIELTRDGVRYLIAVKSGRNWCNSSQLAELKRNLVGAVKVLKQSKQAGQLQPTLGICYGKFKTTDNGEFLHIGGQSFWHLLSGDRDLYTDIIQPLGHQADKFNDEFEQQKNNAYNRMTREFTNEYCDEHGAIHWKKVVQFVSENLPD